MIKETLQVVNITFLTGCLVFETTVQYKKAYVDVVYKSLSRNISRFESFLSGWEEFLSNIGCSKSQFTIILGYLKARSPQWWSVDIATLNVTQIDSVTTTYGFKQLIFDPTRIITQSSSYFDLIFIDQPNCVIHMWYTFFFTS